MNSEPEDQGPDDRGSRPRPWYLRLSLALSAFIMSVSIALINVFYAIRGPEIVVLPPQSVVLYSDPGGPGSVLSIAVPLFMINASTDRSDVVVESTIRVGENGPSFRFENVAVPIQLRQGDPPRSCELRANCIQHPGLLVIEQEDEVLDVPAGGARSRYLSFALTPSACAVGDTACSAHANFESSVNLLSAAPLDLTITLRFYGDGERRVRCRTAVPSRAWLLEQQNQVFDCLIAEVSGAPFF